MRKERDKIRFFINMAHDIRTSLTLINAPIEALNKAPELSEKSRYYVGLATEQSEKLSLIVDQVLTYDTSAGNMNNRNREGAIPYNELVIAENEAKKEKTPFLLIVEDDDQLCDFLKISFGEQFDVSTAHDGVEAWECLCRKTPDLVISDILMPNRDGFELCKLIKSTFETSHIPVILLTALSEKNKQLEGFACGADDYITKPFDMTLLLQRIKSMIRNREIVREKALKLIKQAKDEQPLLTNDLNDRFVKKALDVVHKNISNTALGKDEFASAMNVSPSLLYQKMKALTGQSPTDFIRTVRFDFALELLQTRKYTVAEVSEMCGFASANYFSTAFKKYFGKSPVEV